MLRSPRLVSFAGLAATIALGAGCEKPGGFVTGDPDTHCGSTVVTVDTSVCSSTEVGTDDASPVRFGMEADDDDCKYHVVAGASPVFKDTDVTFNLTVTAKTDDSPVAGAAPSPEVFLTLTHPAPNSHPTWVENPAGSYRLGPVRFDQSGRWTVRFHLFETCADLPTSPHGHVAFYVDVP